MAQQLLRHIFLPGKNIAALLILMCFFYLPKTFGQIAPVLVPNGGFHIEGDLKANTPTPNVGDWLFAPGSGGYIINNDGTTLDTFRTILIKDPFNANDRIFQASKFNDNPNAWSWTTGTASNKSDINNTLFHMATDANNNTWLIVASDRLSTNGTSYIDFEFFQNPVTRNNNGTFTSMGPHAGRTVNDFVLSMEYSNGGSNAIVRFYRWQLVGSSYQYVQVTVPPTAAFAKTNTTNVPVDFGAFGSNIYTPYQFVEAAINISELFGTFDACLGLNIKTIVVKTKASTSLTSSLIDFAEPIQTQLYLNSSSISYPTSLCNTGTVLPLVLGVQSGTFSANSPNLIINPTTGEINLGASLPGNYTITYQYQVNGCPKSTTTNIIISALPTHPTSITSSDNNICSTFNQPITLTANGGSGSVLKWYSGSCGGTYIGSGTSITITPPTSTTTYYARWENRCGNSSCSSITITVFDNVLATVTSTPSVSCHNGNDGQIIVNVNGGTAPYSYCLNNGTPQNSNVFNNLQPGNYNIMVYDANGCQATVSNIVINNPAQLTATVNASSQVSCYNAADGQIVVTANGGTGAYSFSLNGGAAQSSNTFMNLSAGTYTVDVFDANGCQATVPNIVINNPAQLTATVNASSQVSCFNVADGQIVVTANGGTGAFSYSLNGGNAQTSNTFINLPAGTYTVDVYDANGCQATVSNIVINNPAQLTATVNASSQVSCYNAADGQIVVTANGGTGVYSYSLNGGAAQSSNTFMNLPAGIYTVDVFDVNGCQATVSNIVINNPAQLTATVNASSQVSCYNAADGQIVVTANGGTGAYSYSLNGGASQSSNVFSNLLAGTYTIDVYDANGCQATVSNIVISNPVQLTATVNASSQVSCYNAADAQIVVTANGGTGAYSYSLNGGAAQTSNTFMNLPAGTYTVDVYDANGCQTTVSNIIINNPTQLTATVNASSQVSCYNAADGQIVVTANGGTGAYSYSLNGGAAQSSNTFINLPAGAYTVDVFDANGCQITVSNIIINNPTQLTATVNASSQVSCNNVADGQIVVTANGGTGAYSYSLNSGATQSSNVFSNLPAGTYTADVYDANGCQTTVSNIIINNPAQLTAAVNASSQVSCYNAADGQIVVTANGGTGTYSYSLNGGAAQSSNTFMNLSAGTYTVDVYDINGCQTTVSNIVINNPAQLTATVNASSQVSCYNAADGQIVVTANGGTGAYSFSLNGGAAQSSNLFANLPAGIYTVDVFDANGCQATVSNIIISNPVQLTAMVNASSQVSCYNAADGQIVVTANGGTGAYSYSLNGGTAQTSNTFMNLSAGTYTVDVYDINGCQTTVSNIVINNPAQLTATVNASSQVSCNNVADGQIVVTANGGTGAYSYSLNGGTAQTSNTFLNLPAGTYTVDVYDANGCQATVSNIVINNPAQLTATVNASSQVSCYNAADAQIVVTANGGTGAYSYSLNGGATQSSNTFINLPAGTYTVDVYDANGCQTTVSNIVINNPAQLTATVNASSQVSCYNAADGQIVVTANGGTGAYSYSLNGGAAQTSNTFVNLPAGTYTVDVYDANGCQTTVSNIIINNPTQLTATVNASSQVSCYNAADGQIVVTANGGTGAYSYSLNGGAAQTSNTFVNLPAGTYTVDVYDANGCQTTVSNIIINNPTQLTATVNASSQVSCYNAADGQIVVTANGGTGVYSYSLNGGAAQSSNTFINLPAGIYTVDVFDANGCQATVSNIVINNPAQLTATVNASLQVSCYNAADGQIVVTANGGTGAYSYSLNGGAAQSSNIFTNLPAGTYTIDVYDANGCQTTVSNIIIANPPRLNGSVNASSQVSCYNAADGQIVVTANGGTGAYSYSLNSGVAQSSNVFTNLPAGTYTVDIYDANGCQATVSNIVINNPAQLTATVNASSQVSCYNAADAQIVVTANGGTGAYSYSLNGGIAQSSNIFSNLPSGTYTVDVFDANGCQTTVSNIVINNPTQLTATVNASSQVSCYNAADGQIVVTANGGTGAYSYSLNGGTAQTSNTFLNLPAGTYTVDVYDANGCQATVSNIVINNPAQLTATVNASSQVSCYNAADAQIVVTANGGTGAYSYSLNGGAAQTSNTFTNLPSGIYTIDVYDANGCFVTLNSITIQNPNAIVVESVDVKNISCFGYGDGEISLVANGGTGSLLYSLNNGTPQQSPIFSNLTSGIYYIQVLDEQGCVANYGPIMLVNPPQLTLEYQASSQVSCHNGQDGQISLFANGGTGAYQYVLNGNISQSTPVFDNLIAGTYNVMVIDENGCSAKINDIVISNPTAIQANYVASEMVSCYNANNGYIHITAHGGSGNLQYSIDGINFQSNGIFESLTAGTYNILITDENGCTHTINSIVIQNPLPISIQTQIQPVTCANNSDGQLTVVATGGTGNYLFSINNGSFQSNGTFAGLSSGNYFVQVVDANGCSASQLVSLSDAMPIEVSYQMYCKAGDVMLNIYASGGNGNYLYSIDNGQTFSTSWGYDDLTPGTMLNIVVIDGNNCASTPIPVMVQNMNTLQATVSVVQQNICYGQTDAVIQINAVGGSAPYSYYLNNQPIVPQNGQIQQLPAGSHVLLIKDANGCPFETSFEISAATPIVANVVKQTDADCYQNNYGKAEIEVSGGNGPYNILWSNGETTYVAQNLAPGLHTVSITDANNCQQTQQVQIGMSAIVVKPAINNVFTPNGDGKNDTWVITNLELFKENELYVYNRWGNEVYTIKNYRNNWDGSDLTEGTYFYILKVKDCEQWFEFNGYVTILR